MKLSDQIVLVTGSSRGLGLAIARACVKEGAKVVLNFLKSTSKETVEAVGRELNAFIYQADVTDAGLVKNLFAAAEQHYGRPITTVVNNALAHFSFNGDAREKLDTISWADFDRQLKGSLQGALNTVQAAIPGFRELGFGRVINIGSNLVQNPVVPYHDYTASKGAVLAFTRTMAAELGPEGITSNMVAGGLLRVTDASRETPDSVFEQIKAVTPLRKVVTPEEMAGAVLFFASPWARAVTGQQLIVDGGLVMN
ncbi:3-oxoacyl-[acyl-carrier-protein] reductase [Hypocenomyce scalaris]|nr:3-oxoacyl-[acyl-carrier-protein] reductase [Hypocenomyce scalaris]